jgi:hypothetical protein
VPSSKEVLTSWIVEYVKSKDLLTKHITAIKTDSTDADVVIEGALKNQFVIIQPVLGDLSRLSQLKDKHIVLVTANTRANLEFLVTHWAEFVAHTHLSVYFVNPNSALDKRWVIFPATHDSITERKALRKGLESLFLTVEEWKA